MFKGRNQLFGLALACMLAAPLYAQGTLNWPQGEFVPYALDSGAVGNVQRDSSVVFSKTITVQDAVWLRLYFTEADLQPGSYIRMTAAFDNEIQELDATDLAMWNYTSAYFNGDTVRLELIAAPGTSGNRIALDQVAAYIVAGGLRGPCADDDCGMCGSDDRVLSSELWSCRIMPVGCTGSVYNSDSCVVSAGHCADGGWDDTLQFNVPASSSSCYPHNPPVADQFPVTSHLFNNGGVGNDWSVMIAGTNSVGQTPYERYGVYRPIASTLASAGQSSEVWGYGVDNSNPTRSQVQQYSNGTIGSRTASYYTYNDDVTYGNSGSALLHNDEIIGIVTHCSFDCGNIATRIDRSAFVSAREQLCAQGCPVNFISQPEQSQTVCDGDFVQLSVEVEESYLMTYQWRKGETNLVDDGAHILGATSDTLTIIDFSAADEASDYNCVVTNTIEECSETSNNAEILLDPDVPVITGQPSDATIDEGGFVIFTVTVEDPLFVSYQWRHDGADLSNGGRISGADADTLTIVLAEMADAGDYDCVITYDLGAQCSTTSDVATLTVNASGNDCPEDLNGDGHVGLEDLSTLLSNYGQPGVGPEDGDFDEDGDVDLADLSQLLSVYGQDCPTH